MDLDELQTIYEFAKNEYEFNIEYCADEDQQYWANVKAILDKFRDLHGLSD